MDLYPISEVHMCVCVHVRACVRDIYTVNLYPLNRNHNCNIPNNPPPHPCQANDSNKEKNNSDL